jgi:hypothetical protein
MAITLGFYESTQSIKSAGRMGARQTNQQKYTLNPLSTLKMSIIDQQGRLFGWVNVVDLFVVVLVCSTLVAGVAVVNPLSDDAEPAQRFATVDLGTHPNHIAAQVGEGDRMRIGARNMTVEDVYYSPRGNDSVKIFTRLRIPGEEVSNGVDNAVFYFDGEPLRPGSSIDFETATVSLTGTIVELETSGRELPTVRQSVLIETTVPSDLARSIVPGDSHQVSGKRIGEIVSVRQYPTSKPKQRRVLVGLTLKTIEQGGIQRFGTSPLRTGSTIVFVTDSTGFRGSVLRRGVLTNTGDADTITATIQLEGVNPLIARSIRTGMREEINGNTTLRVTGVSVNPATAIVESDDGQIYGRDHPRLKNVNITTEMTVRRFSGELNFHGEPIKENREIVIDFPSITVEGRIIEIDR